MIELFERESFQQNRKSSKGNQLKWKSGSDWYKADYTGYEGLVEYMVSHLCGASTLEANEYALYELEQIRYRGTVYNGCRSHDFLEPGYQLITLERLHKNQYGESLHLLLWKLPDAMARLRFLVDRVEKMTGLKNFGIYMNKTLTVDGMFLNEDRHLHNLAVQMNSRQQFKYCPIFDNGAGLLADTMMDYPLGRDPLQMIHDVQAKTIDSDFDEQMTASERLYGRNIFFSFTRNDVDQLLEKATEYPEEIRNRVRDLILERKRTRPYLFR